MHRGGRCCTSYLWEREQVIEYTESMLTCKRNAQDCRKCPKVPHGERSTYQGGSASPGQPVSRLEHSTAQHMPHVVPGRKITLGPNEHHTPADVLFLPKPGSWLLDTL